MTDCPYCTAGVVTEFYTYVKIVTC